MTVVLVVLAIGAVVAGFAGVPPALGGNNAIEHFLAPSFEAAPAGTEAAAAGTALAADTGGLAAGAAVHPAAAPEVAAADGGASRARPEETGEAGGGLSTGAELGLMLFSVLIGVTGIAVAYRFYVRRPEIAARLKERLAGPHRVLTNKYYVDELYGATVIRGTVEGAGALWTFDRNVVDGAVNGSGWLTIFSSWFSGVIDKYLVDGLVNLVGSILQEASFVFRRFQTGLVQNYALLMLIGVFAFVSIYLLVR
jgi:NADH-quinone oxidoreductase subunit L